MHDYENCFLVDVKDGLSDGHIKQLDEQLQDGVRKLMELAEAVGNEKIPVDMNLPDEITLREDEFNGMSDRLLRTGIFEELTQ